MLKGLKKAVGDYQRFNKGGCYSPEYGHLMYNTNTGELWTDYFYSIGHNSWKVYHDDAIIRIDNRINDKITMKSVANYIDTIKTCKNCNNCIHCFECANSANYHTCDLWEAF